jgi:hypothetical protein
MNTNAIQSHQGQHSGQWFAAAVVMPTILRPSLRRAVQSVYAQDAPGVMQLLLGIDKPLGDPSLLNELVASKPDNWVVTIFDLGYSTSVRHGGIYPARDGGALRTILSYAANSRYVAYLDDDNWWAPDHLSSLLGTIAGVDWAYSKRWFVDAASQTPLAVDNWESVGPDQGVFRDKFGGFVDPNTLLIDKILCDPVLRCWSFPWPGDLKGMSADRQVFDHLRRNFKGRGSGKATCFYVMDPNDDIHPMRLRLLQQARQPKPAAPS